MTTDVFHSRQKGDMRSRVQPMVRLFEVQCEDRVVRSVPVHSPFLIRKFSKGEFAGINQVGSTAPMLLVVIPLGQ